MSPRNRRNSRRSYGNVRQRTPGRWEARYTGPDGVRRPIGTFESEKAANAALARVLSDVYQGTYREPETGDVPLREYAQRWLATRDLKPSTLDGYERLLQRWILTPLPSPGGARQLDLGALPLRSLSHTMVRPPSLAQGRRLLVLMQRGVRYAVSPWQTSACDGPRAARSCLGLRCLCGPPPAVVYCDCTRPERCHGGRRHERCRSSRPAPALAVDGAAR
jgi:hypothetical protein